MLFRSLNLMKTKNIIITRSTSENTLFFFKKTCIYESEGKEVLLCIASINNEKSHENFTNIFKKSVKEIQKKCTKYTIVGIERIGNNLDINTGYKKISEYPISYYFYNLYHKHYNPDQVFILM